MITRQNYEEFFLLYIDGELSAADKQAVELFVQENADLADELALFQQMQLPAEQLDFAGKPSLYRFEAGDINIANYEELFLLYVDNELDTATREKVEMFVLQHPGFQEHFTVLKQTKLPSETIVFADKSSLYRKEEKRPFVYLHWRKLAIAAVLIGLSVSVWMVLPGKEGSQQTLAQQVTGKKAVDQQNTVVSKENPTASSVQVAENNTKNIALQNKTVNSAQVQQQDGSANNIPVKPDNLLAQNTPPPVIEPKQETTAPVISTPVETTHVAEKSFADNASTGGTEVVKNSGPSDEATNPVAQTAVYKELDTDDEKKSLYVGSLEINKDKLRGFFRKATNLFRSKAKLEEENNRSENTTPASHRSLP